RRLLSGGRPLSDRPGRARHTLRGDEPDRTLEEERLLRRHAHAARRPLELAPTPVALVERVAVFFLQRAEPPGEGGLVLRAHPFAAGKVPAVPLRKLRELALEMGQEAAPRRGSEPERRPNHVASTDFLPRRHQAAEPGPIVG